MPTLNYETYKLLEKAAIDANPMLRSADIKDWYELTYQLFQDAPLNEINDLWRIVAFTYSWMPTIPEVKAHLVKDADELLARLRELRNGDVTHLAWLFEQLIPVINNSLVGTSKVLHFIAPSVVPIIDRNVLKGWDLFFFKKLHRGIEVAKLPSYNTSLNTKHIQHYLAYRNTLTQWVAQSEQPITLRALELGLFELGKNTIEKKSELRTISYQ